MCKHVYYYLRFQFHLLLFPDGNVRVLERDVSGLSIHNFNLAAL